MPLNPDHTRNASRGEATRQRILSTALSLFREQGFDQTTMRAIAQAAQLSLGAAYYYFDSKEALVLAYYRELMVAHEAALKKPLGEATSLGERILVVYRSHLELVGQDRKLLGALIRKVADPQSRVSLFSAETQEMRNESIQHFYEALDVDEVPQDLREVGARGLWTLHLALILYFIWDESPNQTRTTRLTEDLVALLLPLLPLLRLPLVKPLRTQLATLMQRAGLLGAPDKT